MYRITEHNIAFMENDLRQRGITTESLRQNLIDHISILIEKDLGQEGDFEAYYQSVIKTFYVDSLEELQKETNHYLSIQNKHIMKKAMMICGAFSAAGFIGGSVGKIFLFRLTDFFLFLGFAGFVFLFLPLVFLVRVKGLKRKNELIMYLSGTISLMLYFFCMLMKCLFWPSSNSYLGFENAWLFMWLTGLGTAIFVFIPSYVNAGIRKPETKINTVITATLLVAFIGVQFRLTNIKPLRPSSTPVTSIENTPPTNHAGVLTAGLK